ncbi:MAG: DUF2141 domain-containing protein [Thiomicrorhabdus sp.]|nr:DUF2141 domain-containing protein [Thiomicrorhabdus sp.]
MCHNVDFCTKIKGRHYNEKHSLLEARLSEGDEMSIRAMILLSALFAVASLGHAGSNNGFSLKVEVKDLRNSNGVVQFTLYNKDGTIPDEDYEKFYQKQTEKIVDGVSHVVFRNLPKGRYAINVLHDEDKDGEIDKGFLLPTEGVGFSNYSTIGMTNRPNFSKASFELTENSEQRVNIIYF